MVRKILVFSLIASLIGCFVAVSNEVLAAREKEEQKEAPKPVIPPVPFKQKTFGTVGDIEYVDFRAKEPTISVKGTDGKEVKVSLKDLKPEATIIVTYRQEGDKNVLVSLSVVKSAEAPKTAGGGR